MFVICPMSNCGSPQKRDRFLEYLSEIAPVTLASEPECQAYAWFRSAEDNDNVPHHWLRGFEVYDNPEANSVAHRASAPYKAFRAAVGEEKLLDRPSDLRFWRPTGIGFLSRNKECNLMKGRDDSKGPQYLVVNELSPSPGSKEAVLSHLSQLVKASAEVSSVKTFLVLQRDADLADDSLLILTLFDSKEAGESFEAEVADGSWDQLKGVCDRQRTTWVETGIGFIGRS